MLEHLPEGAEDQGEDEAQAAAQPQAAQPVTSQPQQGAPEEE
jgi:hypothetical protein